MAKEHHVWRALDRARENAETMQIDAASARLVVLSDQHRGRRDGADDFLRAERAYNGALAYYLADGYTLLALGDVEELWECRARDVIAAYAHTLELEAAFHQEGRYVRFFGNHDDYWESPGRVKTELGPIFPGLVVHEGLRLSVTGVGRGASEIFLVHGHQGTGGSDQFRAISKFVVRHVWRPIQRLTGWRLNSPATSFKLRGETNQAMYGWAKERGDLLLIAGHTHKPVFLQTLRHTERAAATADLEWLHEIEEAEELGISGGRPCYFNTGCCSFDDGSCTGIEIADGEIRLVRWPGDEDRPQRKILRSAQLADVVPPGRSSRRTHRQGNLS
ncbi:MAG: metallophosphoesterase [Gemmatimonadota bacterium]